MKRIPPYLFIGILLFLPATVQANEPAAKGKPSIDFTNDIAPIFTKLSCNSGGCHGKATGRGGFKLSLFGFKPGLDYQAITRNSHGRRVLAGAPERSLLLMKASMRIPNTVRHDSSLHCGLMEWGVW